MINNSTKLSGMQTLQNPQTIVINFGHCVVSLSPTKKQQLLGKKTLQNPQTIVTNFGNYVESLCLQVTKLFDLLNITRFLKVMVTIHGRKNWL